MDELLNPDKVLDVLIIYPQFKSLVLPLLVVLFVNLKKIKKFFYLN